MATKKQAATATAARVANKGKKCKTRGCDRDAVSKGLCPRCYTAERRKDPEVRAKANEASKRSAAKRKAAKEAAK